MSKVHHIANLRFIRRKLGVNGVSGPEYFARLSADQTQSAIYTAIFLVLTIIVVARGLSEGIESSTK